MRTRADNNGCPTIPIHVNAAPMQAHIDLLIASGYTAAMLCAELSMSNARLWNVRYRHPKMTRRTASRILALEPLTAVPLDDVVVDRLVMGADYKVINATPEERSAAYAARPSDAMARHLGLNATRERAA